jgi:hypothetical protein
MLKERAYPFMLRLLVGVRGTPPLIILNGDAQVKAPAETKFALSIVGKHWQRQFNLTDLHGHDVSLPL